MAAGDPPGLADSRVLWRGAMGFLGRSRRAFVAAVGVEPFGKLKPSTRLSVVGLFWSPPTMPDASVEAG